MFALLAIPICLTGVIALGMIIRAGHPSTRAVVLAFSAVSAAMSSTYVIGRMDGEGVYFTSVKAELNPFLWRLQVVCPDAQKEILRNFLYVATGSKVEHDQYLRVLGKANAALGKLPNQSPLPPGVGPIEKTGGPSSIANHDS